MGWGNLPEAGEPGQGAGLRPGGGREYKSPIVLGGSSAGVLDRLESAKGCVCMCEGLGKRPEAGRGQRAAGWQTRLRPPLAVGQAAWVWKEVPSYRTMVTSVSFKPPSTVCNCGGLLCCPSLLTLKAAWGGVEEGRISKGKGI